MRRSFEIVFAITDRSRILSIENTATNHIHLLNRLGFGSKPSDRLHLQTLGIEAYIDQQLVPQELTEPPELIQQLQSLKTQTQSPIDLFRHYYQVGQEAQDFEDRASAQAAIRNQIVKEAMGARFLRAIDSPRQLQDVMVDFWFNHFNVFRFKTTVSVWLGSYERDAIRPNALGHFRTLLGATAKHPAMLIYLDNWRNTDPTSEWAVGPYKGLNENYARELMELHTLGVAGGYTQADVEALTRILTGWSVIKPQHQSRNDTGFFFARGRHDKRSKTFLGQVLQPNGLQEGEQALDILANHPSTAHYISAKLAQYFVSDTPPQTLVRDLATEFQATSGHIAAVLRRLFTHPEFWADRHQNNKFKTPYQYVLSLIRAVNISNPSSDLLKFIAGSLYGLRMPLYQCLSPDGYSQTQDPWLSSEGVVDRISVANRLAHKYPDRVAEVETLMHELPSLSAQTRSVIQTAPPKLRPALLLAGPEMMYR